MASASKSAKDKKPAASHSVGRWLRTWVFQPAPLIAAAFVASWIVLAPYIPWILPDLSTRPEYQLSTQEIEVTAPPAWVPKSLLEEILSQSELPETVSLLDPDLCRKVAEAWKRHPWVKEVRSVRITGKPGIQVEAAYRVPVAFVEVPGGLYPVDEDGVLLPPADFSMSDTSRLPRIRNVRSQPSGPAGKPWGDVVVHSAASLSASLAPNQDIATYWKRFGFEAILAPIDVRPDATPNDLIFEIRTVGGNRIVWGKPPGADDLEPTIQQKLARLEDYLAQFGSLDAPQGLHRIDIRLFDGISLQRLDDSILR